METFIQKILKEHPELDPLDAQGLAFEAAMQHGSLAASVRYGNQYQRQYDRAFQGLTTLRVRQRREQTRAETPARKPPKSQPLNVLPFEPNSGPPVPVKTPTVPAVP
ncbi:MAG: hypothetical protein HY846_01625 [Nitrosomonadales bacterium]|nr:hypothetical protein [Nitrosomonadales bacterium]